MAQKRKKNDHADRPGQQFAALPFARSEGETRIVLVTSRETSRWVLPKGWAERRLSGSELAAKEAFEEAGVVGTISDESVGSYSYQKRLPDGRMVLCGVDVYPMRVERLLDEWPERRQRKRQWFTVAQAAMLVEESDLVVLLLSLAAGEA